MRTLENTLSRDSFVSLASIESSISSSFFNNKTVVLQSGRQIRSHSYKRMPF